MPIDPEKVALAMANGLSAVCATCRKYWEGQERGLVGHCTSKIKCGSPMAGDTFSDYDGPLNGALHLWCFVCGQRSHFGISVNGSVRVIGACKEHIRYVEQLRAVGAPPTAIEVTNSNGQPPGSMRGYGKKTLGTAIREVEDHYAKKNGES